MLKLLPKDKQPHGFGMELKEEPRLKRKKVIIPKPESKQIETPEILAAKERYMELKKIREKNKAQRNQPIDMTKLLGGN